MWVVVIRGASVHSSPSVAAPIVSYFGVGKELNLVGSEQGWYQVFDPATSQLGWVYAKYYVEPIDRPSGKRVALQEPQAIKVAPVTAAPAKSVRRILQQPQFLGPPQNVQAEKVKPSPRKRDESVAESAGEGLAAVASIAGPDSAKLYLIFQAIHNSLEVERHVFPFGGKADESARTCHCHSPGANGVGVRRKSHDN